ncbi:hypothetical protein [Actinacidiphila paucisporea]|uniref:Peptidase n=1 Tax=Actinacidiphila paucisporea TaxID=310782 RepID=A0A1M7NF06_9ACTN|nr:hypothetical protein [Actinacidiphila paucisporea]SHN02347.1 hypothetical protein SAMN05216499_118105 [Actinacidiphila paucisporea]
MRTARRLAAVGLLAATALTVLTGRAAADATPSATPSASATSGEQGPPTEAGTNFRTATVIKQGQQATAGASAGDYLYWVVPADTGQKVTVKATVTFGSGSGAAATHGASTWQLDVYDGLRRRQPCRYGAQTRTAAAGAATVELACTLRPVRAYADTWSNDPLRGAYYLRLTALDVPEADLGQPVRAAITVTSHGTAGRDAVDGSVAPVVSANAPDVAPAGGWAGTWWSPRWLWTGGGGLLAVLAALGAHRLARGPLRTAHRPRPHDADRPPYPREGAGYSG